MSDTIKYELEGTEQFVEFSLAWKRGEIRLFWRATPTSEREEWLALLQRKIVALRLGDLTGPTQFTEEGLDSLDYSLYEWLQYACIKAVGEVQQLGGACGRRLWATSDSTKDTADRPTNS